MERNVERAAPLRLALAGVDLTAEEKRVVQWLAQWDMWTMRVVAGLFAKLRQGVQP
jgi:hypothetical protein